MNEDTNNLDLFAQQQGGDGSQGDESLFGGGPFDLGSAGGDFPDPFADPAPQGDAQAVGAGNTQSGVTLTFPNPDATPASTHTPVAAPAPAPAPAAAPQTPAGSSDPAENPLAAAMEQVDETNAKKAAEPVMAQLPVFSYNGVSEDIQDVTMTFDELRAAKEDDFPELEEAKDVSWSVTYGKISKSVSTPKKTKIGDFKREIEGSKEFLDALKKSKDKAPKCIVKPRVAMQKKGVLPGYKGVFPTLEEARSSGKNICIIPGRDGRVYDLRRTDVGEFVTGTAKVGGLDEIRPHFTPALPPIPYAIFEQVVSLFRLYMFRHKDGGPSEALAHIYWDKAEGRYFVNVPKQVVSKARVDAVLDDEALFDTDRFIHYADIHSHNTMEARFSDTDDRDERANRVYIVVGRLDRYYPEISVRVCNGGNFLPIRPETVLEPRPKSEVPESWLGNIRVLRPGGQKSELMAA